MSEWFFVDLPTNTIAGLPEPQFPYPIRRETLPLYEQEKQDGLPLLLIADELDAYLEERPDRVERYRREAAHLFLCAGVEAVMDKCIEPSLHYFKLAIWLDPANLSARTNLAMSLHQSGRSEEAVAEYREVIRRGSVWDWWQAWMLCAQELMQLGHYAEALKLLNDAKKVVPDSHLFWDLLAECEAHVAPRCAKCQAEIPPGWSFCGHCGAPMAT
jgi:tetratricopeptide (TPR) repeat protein